MAILRLEKQYWNGEGTVYDGIVAEDDDLDALTAGTATYHGAKIDDMAEGSAVYCIETDTIHVMQADKSWSGVDAAAEEEEET